MIVHVASIEMACGAVGEWPALAGELARRWWPGPLTLVLPKSPAIPDIVTAGLNTVGVRMPAHPIALELIRAAGVPIAAPSANRSTAISPTTAEHVVKSLGDRVDLVLDAGPTGYGIESAIVDVSRAPAVLLRHGAIPLGTLAEHAAIVDGAGAVVAEGERARAPGSHARHYAPRARVLLVPGDAVRGEVEARRARGERTGTLERAPGTALGEPAEVLPDDPAGFAAGLYAALHRLEDAGCAVIVIAAAPEGGAWAAVRDRLRRASA